MALVYAFKTIFVGCFLSQASRIALEEGLYSCILNFIKGLKTQPAIKTNEIFLYIRNFFGFILESITKVNNTDKIKSHFEHFVLRNACFFTLKTIKSQAIVKLDSGQFVLIDKESM